MRTKLTVGRLIRPRSTGRTVALPAIVLLLAAHADAIAKPKPMRPGMKTCTVGELTGIRGQRGQSFIDQCVVKGGELHCDSKGFSGCWDVADPVLGNIEMCEADDWAARPGS